MEGFCSICRLWCNIIGCVRAPCDGSTVVENKYHLVEKGCRGKRPKTVHETTEGLWDLQPRLEATRQNQSKSFPDKCRMRYLLQQNS